MNLCFVGTEYPPGPHGGTGSSYRDLAEGLLAAGHRARVIVRPSGRWLREVRRELHEGIPVLRLPRAPAFLGARVGGWLERLRIRSALQRQHAEEPFTHIEATDYAGLLPRGGIPSVPLIVRIRGSNLFFDHELGRPFQAYEHAQERATLARATHLASVSRYAAERTLSLAGLAARPCAILPNGVNTEVFSPDPAIAVERGLIVFINSLNAKKGIEELLVAANQILPERPEAHLAIIGEDTRRPGGGAYLEKLRAMVPSALRARVTFHGRLPREGVVQWLRRAAIACFPSHMETFGIAALEAMSVGRPTIFTRLGPGPEVVEDGVTGLLCDPRNPGDIARVLRQFLNDPDAAETLGRQARERVLAQFDQRGWVGRNVAFYESCHR